LGDTTDAIRSVERYSPEMKGNIEIEHVHRYAIALELARGKRVLDIASGEGYGASLLSRGAAQVIGVDIAEDTIAHADTTYAHATLEFRLGSCASIPVDDHSIDLVVSFETIEHHDQHEAMMREIRRVLRAEGVLLISTPDKREYSDVPGYRNPFHAKELYLDEFKGLLTRWFDNVRFCGQRVVAGSCIVPLERACPAPFVTFAGSARRVEATNGVRAPLYLLALASNGPLPDLPIGLFEGDAFLWESDHQARLHEMAARLDRERADQDERLRDLSAMLSHQTKRADAATEEICRMKATWSWFLTRPLRAIRSLYLKPSRVVSPNPAVPRASLAWSLAQLRSAFVWRRKLRLPEWRSRNLLTQGCCEVCGSQTDFEFRTVVPDDLAETAELTPRIRAAWDRRESMACSQCRAIFRHRQVARAALKKYGRNNEHSLSALMDSPAFRAMRILVINDGFFSTVLGRHPDCHFPDYIVSLIPGIGPADLKLDWPDDSVDLVLSADALEHTPAYMHAVREIERVLKPGAAWIASLPILPERRTRTRATLADDGHVISLMPPSHHCRGQLDSLVYVEFGADIVGRIEEAGFAVDIYFYNLLDYDYASVYVCNKPARGHVGKSSSTARGS
jgi:ubiquinone/menaquinone biosynthesis C-methylase UbiE